MKWRSFNPSAFLGDVDDEGTVFAVPYLGVATEDQVKGYLKSRFLPLATPEELKRVMALYGPDQTLGSPYGTGNAHRYGRQFKRIASIEGDMVFHVPRRYLLSQTWDKQKAWNYRTLGPLLYACLIYCSLPAVLTSSHRHHDGEDWLFRIRQFGQKHLA